MTWLNVCVCVCVCCVCGCVCVCLSYRGCRDHPAQGYTCVVLVFSVHEQHSMRRTVPSPRRLQSYCMKDRDPLDLSSKEGPGLIHNNNTSVIISVNRYIYIELVYACYMNTSFQLLMKDLKSNVHLSNLLSYITYGRNLFFISCVFLLTHPVP